MMEQHKEATLMPLTMGMTDTAGQVKFAEHPESLIAQWWAGFVERWNDTGNENESNIESLEFFNHLLSL